MSGGIDSACTLFILYLLTRRLSENSTNTTVRDFLTKKLHFTQTQNIKSQEIMNRIAHTAYMGTDQSSSGSQSRTQRMDHWIGCWHSAMDFRHLWMLPLILLLRL